MRLQSAIAIAFILSATSACEDPSLDGTGSELAADESAIDGIPDGPPRPGDYFLAERDTRLCPSPLCGGYFVSSPNRPNLECPDGTVGARCHVGTIDLGWLELGAFDEVRFRSDIDAGRTVIRGQLTHDTLDPIGAPGALIATEGWRAADDNPIRGGFLKLRDTGLVCVTEPCLHYAYTPLNVPGWRQASHLSWPGAGNPEAMSQLLGDGVIVTGMVLYPPTVHGFPVGANIIASHHYLRVDHRPMGPTGSPVATQ
jgi:hypothetical protein